MKKLLFFLLGLIIGITFALMLSGSAFASEDTKVLVAGEGVLKVTVPEKCPEFLEWPSRMLGAKRYPNDNKVAVIESHNGDNVFVTALWLFKEGKFHCIQIMVSYFPIGMEWDKKKPQEEQMKTEFLEDIQFMTTGVPSNSVQWVKEVTPWRAVELRISAQLT